MELSVQLVRMEILAVSNTPLFIQGLRMERT